MEGVCGQARPDPARALTTEVRLPMTLIKQSPPAALPLAREATWSLFGVHARSSLGQRQTLKAGPQVTRVLVVWLGNLEGLGPLSGLQLPDCEGKDLTKSSSPNLSFCCPTLSYLWFVKEEMETCSEITANISKGLMKTVHLSVTRLVFALGWD